MVTPDRVTPRRTGDRMDSAQGYLWTGQTSCHDADGHAIPRAGSGQDAAFRRGIAWPAPRFERQGMVVLDRLTGLFWTHNANPGGLPMMWQEALDCVAALGRERAFGRGDWRLPNRRELRSLVSYQTKQPALPAGHPFSGVFPGWYWTSTSAAIAPAHAWYIHMEGARLFYGGKDQSFLVWPVSGTGNGLLPATGQTLCYGSVGEPIPCAGTGQDGATRCGRPWPVPRFHMRGDTVIDCLTDLGWLRRADATGQPVRWQDALAAVAQLNETCPAATPWRLPNVNELESLVDCATHSPALPRDAPFTDVRDGYWSSTTSLFEPDWAWALYADKGAIGVGQKCGTHFFVWAVRDVEDDWAEAPS